MLSCNILAWNVWSILNKEKLSNLLQIIEDKDIHIACLTETWFDAINGQFTAVIKEAGFKIVHDVRTDKQGGGTAILDKEKLKVKRGQASSSKYESFEFSYIFLKNDSSNILLLCIYRKQEVLYKTFCEELELFLDGLPDTSELLIVGDFNV